MNSKRFNKILKNLKTNETLFTELYEYYYPKIQIHVYRKFRNRTLSEDTAQDFFVKIFETEPEQPVEFPTAWVYAVADNIAKNTIAKTSREFSTEDTPKAPFDEYENELYGDCAELLRQLDADSRELVILHIFEGYSLKELVPIIGIQYPALRQRYNRIIKNLRRLSHLRR